MAATVQQIDNNCAAISIDSSPSDFDLFVADLVSGAVTSSVLSDAMCDLLSMKLRRIIAAAPAAVLAFPTGFLSSLFTLGDSAMTPPVVSVVVSSSVGTVTVSGYDFPCSLIFSIPHSISPGASLDQVSTAAGGYKPSDATIQEGGGVILRSLVLDNGRVMVIGGLRFYSYPNGSAAVDLWEAGQWSALAPLPTGRMSPLAVFLRRGIHAGKVLVAGGFDPLGDFDLMTTADIKSDAWLYDFDTDTWTATGNLADALFIGPGYGQGVELDDGRVLVAGSAQAATWGVPPFPYGQGGGASNAVQVWDPATGIWSFVDPMTQERFAHSTTLLQDGRVLVVGGRDFCNDVPNSVLLPYPGPPYPMAAPPGAVYLDTYEIYDPGADAWTAPVVLPSIEDGPTGLEKSSMDNVAPIGPLPGPFLEVAGGATRCLHYAQRLDDGRVLIIGGLGELSGAPTTPQARRGCLIFDPKTDLFSIGPNMIRASVRGPHSSLRGAWVFVAGGMDESMDYLAFNDQGSPTTQMFDPDDDSWRQLDDVPTSLLGRVAADAVAMCNSFGDVIITGGNTPAPDFFDAKTVIYEPFLPFVRSPKG